MLAAIVKTIFDCGVTWMVAQHFTAELPYADVSESGLVVYAMAASLAQSFWVQRVVSTVLLQVDHLNLLGARVTGGLYFVNVLVFYGGPKRAEAVLRGGFSTMVIYLVVDTATRLRGVLSAGSSPSPSPSASSTAELSKYAAAKRQKQQAREGRRAQEQLAQAARQQQRRCTREAEERRAEAKRREAVAASLMQLRLEQQQWEREETLRARAEEAAVKARRAALAAEKRRNKPCAQSSVRAGRRAALAQ